MAFDLFSLSKERRDVLKNIYFDQYVDKKGPDDCWEWKGSRRNSLKDYGSFHKRFGKQKFTWQAHRVAWMFHYNAPVPAGLMCCHSCDNPPCTNPLHIFIGTAKHNAQDAKHKRLLRARTK